MFEKGGGVWPFRDKPCGMTDVVLAQRKVGEFKGGNTVDITPADLVTWVKVP